MEQQIRTYAHKALNKLGYSVWNLSNGGFFVKNDAEDPFTLSTSIELGETEIYKFAIAHLESELSEQSKGHPDMDEIKSALNELRKQYDSLKDALDNIVVDLDSAEFILNGNTIEVESIKLESDETDIALAEFNATLDNLRNLVFIEKGGLN